MAVIVSVFAIVLISMLINRIATIALVLTGMSREEARFQARAAMSGVGLTTRSPDDIVAHPVRRRIVLYLMILGSAGIITGIASLVLSFNGGTAGQRLIRAAVLVGALFGLWLLSRTKPVDRALSKAIGWVLCRWGFAARDYAAVLELSGDYAVAELQVQEGDWLAGRSLRELRLRDEGVVVMGIKRGRHYLGAPGPETVLEPKDTLVLYGREERISELDRRPRGAAGDAAHCNARSQERNLEADEDEPPRQQLKTATGS
jgi:TrkA-C domain